MRLRWSSFYCAFAGVWYLLRTQAHARWHLLATLVVVVAGFIFHLFRYEWLTLVLAMGLVWVAEALNTAIEQACDAITEEQHPNIRHAKDLAAGAVLVAAGIAIVVGLLIFGPRLLPKALLPG